MPSGQYDSSRIVNIGTNRWFFKPEVGISQALGSWTLEAQAAVTFFTDNKDFVRGNTRSQDPIYSLQGHAIYGFRSGHLGFAGRHLLRRRPHDDQQRPERRPPAELAGGRHAGISRGRPQLHQDLRQQWRIVTHRQ
ncbi:transporter [Candidatus Accumulibacter contiguus]|jgi:hypothetical protein|uniref:transporter n=1 Tax=Candidatus Accumulibacter contiguus TaxID=2954381 RepID=UPI002FC38272